MSVRVVGVLISVARVSPVSGRDWVPARDILHGFEPSGTTGELVFKLVPTGTSFHVVDYMGDRCGIIGVRSVREEDVITNLSRYCGLCVVTSKKHVSLLRF